MLERLQTKIAFLFYILFISVPLVLYPKTSEIFEFNKMVFVYFFTILIASLWVLRMIVEKHFIFQKTLLDAPLIIFLTSQLLSTIFSIDRYTSIFGYYSRFHGGLLSTICYLILYFAFVSNMSREETLKSIKVLFLGGTVASVWGIFEHFGRSFSCLIFPEFQTFDVSCWVQDVQHRVYATFGQPNWLAAWMVAVLPLTWASMLNIKNQNAKKHVVYNLAFAFLSFVFFITLLFTKSRSGILAFSISFLIFWILTLINTGKEEFRNLAVKFTFVACFLLLVTFLIGTPWTPKLSDVFSNPTTHITQPTPNAPALETGGTESGKIRQIVWRGTIDVWKNYPLLGSGVETFGYSYYQFRPVEHNLVSEWDYLYNKAHNEYLNFLATTGVVGIIAYLNLILFSVLQILKTSKIPDKQNLANDHIGKHQFQITNSQLKAKSSSSLDIWNWKLVIIGIISGYSSILITNFFGFSVVPVALLFFLFPAFAVSISDKGKDISDKEKTTLNTLEIASVISLSLITCYLLFAVVRYWHTDYLYAKATNELSQEYPEDARDLLLKIVDREPKNALYWDELAESSANLSVLHLENGNNERSLNLSKSALNETRTALTLSPANVSLKRNASTHYIKLVATDPSLLFESIKVLKEALELAPTDPKIYYNISLSYLRTGNYEEAIKHMEKAIELKPDYERARYSVALMYIDVKEKTRAKEHFNYILEKINPNNEVVKKELSELTK